MNQKIDLEEQKRIQLEQLYEKMHKAKNELDKLQQQAYELEMEIVKEARKEVE